MRLKIDINCDLGESYGAFKVGNDAGIMPHITSANIACGFHAGDPTTIAQTVNLAKKHKVGVGAHPGFPDLMGFGRREMQLTPEETRNYVLYQVSAVRGFVVAHNGKLQHVKPHGALYNMAAKDFEISKAIVSAVKVLDRNLIVLAPPRSELAKVTIGAGMRVANEFFADRAYNSDGNLASRNQPNTIIQDPHKVVERAVKAVKEKTVLTANGEAVNLGDLHTICVHGDSPAAVRLAEALHKGLAEADIEIVPVGDFV